MADTETDLPVTVDPPEGFYNREDGIYQNIPWADYHEVERASQTVLSELLDKSPAHARAQMQDEYKETPAKKLGNAIHSAVLEPQLFNTEWGTKEQCSGTTSSGDRCSRSGKHPVLVEETEAILWYCGTHYEEGFIDADLRVLSEKQMETVQEVRASVLTDNKASFLLYGVPHVSELTVLWTHNETGVKCKSRVDKIIDHPDYGVIPIDLKTTRDASPGERGFPRSAAQYGYHRQAAFYRQALISSGVPIQPYYMILAVEKEPPYAVVSYLFMDDENQQPLSEGSTEMLNALKEWKKCQVAGEWPSYTDGMEVLWLPEWAFN